MKKMYKEQLYRHTSKQLLDRVNEGFESFQKNRTYSYPEWLYGSPKGDLLKVKVFDSPSFGEDAFIEIDTGRTAFISIDMQTDFCGENGYVDTMKYDLSLTAAAIKPIKKVLDCLRETDVDVIHTREGHLPDLSDAPYNKLLRSKIIGKGYGIGEVPPNGIGKLLVRGEPNWDIIDELYPLEGEYIIDKSGKGGFNSSVIHNLLINLDVKYLFIGGITTDVCVHTIMREANDYGYWCILLEDCAGATDHDNHLAAIKQIKMQGGVFGNVSNSDELIKAFKAN